MTQIAYILFWGLFILPITAGGAEPQDKGQTEQQQKEEPSQQEKASKSRIPVNSDFQPSERIKADTVVAFPADI